MSVSSSGVRAGIVATATVRARQASTGSQGPIGPTGPAGPVGGGSYNFTQAVPSLVWTIIHNLGFKPNVETFDNYNDQVEGDLIHVSINQCTITFSYQTTGTAILS